MAMLWMVSACNDPEGQDEFASGKHDNVEAAKAQLFDLITSRGICQVEYNPRRTHEEFMVTPMNQPPFVALIFGFHH